MRSARFWLQNPAAIVACLVLAGVTAFGQSAAPAGESNTELAQKVNNPVASIISIPIQNEWYFGVGPKRETVYTLQVMPVVPVALNPNWNLMLRFVMPFAHVPVEFGGIDFLPQNAPSGATNGIGDLAVSAWVTPARMPQVGKGKLLVAAGAALTMPTATSQLLGSGRWNGGPSVLLGYQRGRVMTGSLVQNLWSYAGPASRDRVNQFLMQPFWSYRLDRGWSILAAPPLSLNWRRDRDRWTVPVGGGVNKLVRLRGRPVALGAEALHYAIRPAANGPRWMFRFQVRFLIVN